MRTIVAGSRTWSGPRHARTMHRVLDRIHQDTPITTVLSGTARGADMIGERWAEQNRLPVERYPADWNEHGRVAGLMRNIEMVQNADTLVAFWDGWSRGTLHTIKAAKKKGLTVHVFRKVDP